MYREVPQELKEVKHWCFFKLVPDEKRGKMKKVPFNPHDGGYGASNNEETWSDFNTAVAANEKYNGNGIGFYFKEPYIGIDLDDIAGEIERYKNGDFETNMIFEFIETFKSYSEISISGTGLHIIAKGKIPGSRRRKDNVEVYSSGRFFTVSGNKIGRYDDVNSVSDLNMERIYKKYLETKVIQFNRDGVNFSTIDLSESEIIASILRSRSRDKFLSFMNGGWEKDTSYSSQSEADLAFANMLAFWCGRDFSKMDSLFRQSSLMREKWDEKRGGATYGEATLNRAIHDTMEIYTPKREPLKYDLAFLENKKKTNEHPPRSWDDTGNANRFMDHFGDLVRYSFIDKKWYFYNGSFWEVDFKGNVRNLIDLMVEDMAKEPIAAFGGLSQEDAEKEFRKHIKRSRSNSGKKAIQDELKHRVPVMPDEFDKERMLLNTKNGFLDLTSGILNEHDMNMMFSRETNAEFTDKTDAPEWHQFLHEIFDGDKEIIDYMQKAVGYSLTSSTKEQVMFILHGGGRNGKSIFLETISDLMGTYANSMQATSIMIKQNTGINTDIARLKGARLVTSSEPNEGFRFDEGLIKQLTGGDKVTARKLYGEEFEFNPEFKLWLATNHKPIIRGTDDGIWRRMIVIPFNVQIPEHKVDKDLKYKLQREASGILNWAVNGCLKWQREGLKTPESIQQSVKVYRSEMDVIEAFVDECLVRDENRTVPASQVYKLYKQWANDNTQYLMSSTKFGKEFGGKFEKKRTKTGNMYFGVGTKYDLQFLSNSN